MKVREQGGDPAKRWLAVEGRWMAASWSPDAARAELRRLLSFDRRMKAGVPLPKADR